jgi:hypothetical protein
MGSPTLRIRDMNIWSGNLKTGKYLVDQDTDGGNIKIIIKNIYFVFNLMSNWDYMSITVTAWSKV